MQLRVCIAVCVFIFLASIPLHFVEITPGKYTIFNLPKGDNGGVLTAVFYSFDYASQKITLKYQNRSPFPKNAEIRCVFKCSDSNGKILPIPQSNVNMEIMGSRNDIIKITAQLPMQFSKVDNKRVQVGTLKHLDKYSVIIDFYHGLHKHLARLSGNISKRERHLQSVKLDKRIK